MKIAILLPLEEKDIKILEEFDKTGRIIDNPGMFLVALLIEFMKHDYKLFAFSISRFGVFCDFLRNWWSNTNVLFS